MDVALSEQDIANIREALYLAADSVEDIDDPLNYEAEDLASIKREAAEYRSLATRLSEFDPIHREES